MVGRRFRWLLLVLLAACAVIAGGAAADTAATTPQAERVRIPLASSRMRLTVIREAQRVYGLDAPVARFAAQIHQESLWNASAASRYANGLAQFTPPTAEWIAKVYPELHPAAPWDAHWSVRAMVRYMRHIETNQADAATPCDRWAFALSGYNGGPAWVTRDRKRAHLARADPNRWFGEVELHTARAAWARKENRDYVRRILLSLEPAYSKAGWPGDLACEPVEEHT